MKHTFIYKGRLSLNFDSLTENTTHYKKPEGTKAEYLYSKSADGLEFGFMEKVGTGAFAVTVGPVILDVPLKIDPARHTDGKRFGPSPMLFGDDSAKRLLADAIRLNPQKAEDVLDYIWMRMENEGILQHTYKGYADKMINFLNDAFRHPERYIGSSERNTEVKICYNLLSYLGWNPITDIAAGFQIQKTKLGEIARTAHAVDFALRDDAGIRLLGEVKHWFVSNSGWQDGLDQIRRYQKAIPVERCFLSCGHRWAILNRQGEVVADIKEKKDVNKLIEQLTPYLGKESDTKPVTGNDIWSYGICPSSVIPKGTPNLPEGKFLSWEPDEYDDETIAYRVRALKDFADKYDLIKDIGTTALIVRLSGKLKIVEYRPFNPEINVSLPKYDLERLNISDELIKEFGALTKRCRDGKEGFYALLDMLERIVLFHQRN